MRESILHEDFYIDSKSVDCTKLKSGLKLQSKIYGYRLNEDGLTMEIRP
ncbi:hypothetical protein [Succinivibrio dextrinosolvens]|nr:hypothetical protein [Succinivibrio dextrinosolvens]